MKKIHLLFLIIALTILGSAHADTTLDFCAEVTKTRSPKDTTGNSIKFLWKYILNPKSLVELQKITTSNSEFINDGRIKIAFLSLPHQVFVKSEQEELKALENKRKSLSAGLKVLTKTKSTKDCLEYVFKENLSPNISALHSMIPRFLELNQKKNEAKSFDFQKSKKTFLKRNGWKVFENKNLNEIYKIILETNPNDVLLVGHASNDGKLYDALKNPLPKSFFKALNIENLILYSCYSEETKNYYSFNNYNIFFANPTIFAAEFLDQSVPLSALRVIKGIDLKSSSKEPAKICTLNFPIEKTSNLLGVTINKTLVGPLSPELNFPCDLLSERTTIEIFSTLNDRHIGSIGISTVHFQNDVINLDEFRNIKNDRHIVSRGTLLIKRSSYEIN